MTSLACSENNFGRRLAPPRERKRQTRCLHADACGSSIGRENTVYGCGKHKRSARRRRRASRSGRALYWWPRPRAIPRTTPTRSRGTRTTSSQSACLRAGNGRLTYRGRTWVADEGVHPRRFARPGTYGRTSARPRVDVLRDVSYGGAHGARRRPCRARGTSILSGADLSRRCVCQRGVCGATTAPRTYDRPGDGGTAARRSTAPRAQARRDARWRFAVVGAVARGRRRARLSCTRTMRSPLNSSSWRRLRDEPVPPRAQFPRRRRNAAACVPHAGPVKPCAGHVVARRSRLERRVSVRLRRPESFDADVQADLRRDAGCVRVGVETRDGSRKLTTDIVDVAIVGGGPGGCRCGAPARVVESNGGRIGSSTDTTTAG